MASRPSSRPGPSLSSPFRRVKARNGSSPQPLPSGYEPTTPERPRSGAAALHGAHLALLRHPPPARDDLVPRVEPHAVGPGGVEVAEEGVLPPREREEGHRRGDPDVDAEHPGLGP